MCLHKKCNWCDKRKPDTFKFKGWNKYTGLTICTDCFEKNGIVYHINIKIVSKLNILFFFL